MPSPPDSKAQTDGTRSVPGHAIDRVVPVNMRNVLWRTLWTGLIFSVVLAGMVLAYYRVALQNNLRILESGRDHIQHLAALAVQEEMAAVLSDARYLSRHNDLLDFLFSGGALAGMRLGAEYVHFLGQKRDYGQIRLLSLTGRERVRVDRMPGGARVVPADNLKDFSRSGDFPEIAKLGVGEIYVSPMHLHFQKGIDEQANRPVIRIATPALGPSGQKQGFVVLDFRAQRLISRLHEIGGTSLDIWLVNRAGYWLSGSNRQVDLGGMPPPGQGMSMAARYPAAWRQIQRQMSGMVEEGGVWFRYQRVFPLTWKEPDSEEAGLAIPVGQENYFWTMVLPITQQDIAAMDRHLIKRLGLSYCLMVLFAFAVAAALSWVSARNRTLMHLLATVVDNAPMLVAYVDSNYRYRFNNLTYLKIFGVTPRALYGHRIHDVLGEKSTQACLPYLRQALSGQAVDFEIRLLEARGGPRDLSVTCLPDVSPDGVVRGYYLIANDITQLKEAERRDRQRLLELAHVSRLASVGEVSTEIAHQINQPLAAIAMYSSAALRTLRNGGEEAQVLQWLEQANLQAHRAGEIIRYLRRFARKGTPQRAPVPLNEVVREVINLMRFSNQVQDVVIDLDLDEHLPMLRGDRILLEQVVYNLVRNALDAVMEQPQTGHLQIRTSAIEGSVRFELADNGPGVGEGTTLDIFDPFVSDKPSGIGIGLAISRSIVEAHGGTIGYVNRPEGGAVFNFSIPEMHGEQ